MEFITDRTEMDVLLGNEKGVYSHIDLNRVESNVADLAQELRGIGFDTLNLTTKTDWGLPEDFSADKWPTESQMERYLQNVRVINEHFPLEGNGKLPKTMDKLTVEAANLIEKILEHIQKKIKTIRQTWKYSGEIFAGEE